MSLERTGPQAARYSVTATGVGHRLPTYVTPRLTMQLVALGASGHPVTRATYAIQRRVDIGLRKELADTRLRPGETASLSLSWSSQDAVTAVVGSVFVEPDEYHQRFFEAFTPADRVQRRLVIRAQEAYRKSAYTIHRRWLRF